MCKTYRALTLETMRSYIAKIKMLKKLSETRYLLTESPLVEINNVIKTFRIILKKKTRMNFGAV